MLTKTIKKGLATLVLTALAGTAAFAFSAGAGLAALGRDRRLFSGLSRSTSAPQLGQVTCGRFKS